MMVHIKRKKKRGSLRGLLKARGDLSLNILLLFFLFLGKYETEPSIEVAKRKISLLKETIECYYKIIIFIK